jgi:hypothetical protein
MTVKLLTELIDEPVYYGDIQYIDKTSHEINNIGDESCPPSLAGEVGPARFAEHGIPTEGAAGGLSVDLVCKPGEGVLARLGRSDGKFEMLIHAVFATPLGWSRPALNAVSALAAPSSTCTAMWGASGPGTASMPCWGTEHLYDELSPSAASLDRHPVYCTLVVFSQIVSPMHRKNRGACVKA